MNYPICPYPDDPNFHNNNIAPYEETGLVVKNEEFIKNFPAQSYTTHQNHCLFYPAAFENGEINGSILGHVESFYLYNGKTIEPYTLGQLEDNEYFTEIKDFHIMIDFLTANGLTMSMMNPWDLNFDIDRTENNKFADLYKNERAIRNIKIYVVFQKNSQRYDKVEDAVKNGAKIVTCENCLSDKPIHIKVPDCLLHPSEHIFVYCHIMFNTEFIMAAKAIKSSVYYYDLHDITADSYVVDVVSVLNIIWQ